MTIKLKVWHPGEDCESHSDTDVGTLEIARRVFENNVYTIGGTIEVENHGAQAGEHITLVIAIASLALQLPQSAESLLKLAANLREYLRVARTSRTSMGVAEADQQGLLLLAYAEIRKANPEFRTDPELIQVMDDGQRRYKREAPGNESYEGFPVGVFLFRIPDLASERTHIIEVRSNGEILGHSIRNELTADAVEYLESEFRSVTRD